MATITTTLGGGVGGANAAAPFGYFLPAYWDSVLGENLYPNLFLMQFGTKRTIPRNFGRSIKIPRYKKLSIVASIASGSEGAAITPTAASAQMISGGLSQFAGAIKHSDLLLMTAMSDFVEMSIADLARDMAKKIDTKIRDVLSATGIPIGGTRDTSTALSLSVGKTTGILKPRHIIRAAVRLDDANNTRPPDMYYPAIIAPRAVYDLQTNLSGGGWLDVTKYQTIGAPRIYQGEVGRLYGVRFVASTNVKRLVSGLSNDHVGGTLSVNTSGYQSYVFAPNAYYVTELNGDSAKTFVKQLGSAGAADPVNQFATVGAKVFFGCLPAAWTASEYRMARLYYSTSF